MLIETRRIIKTFKSHANKGLVKAVDDVSLSIKPQESLGLVGESGCGKTTLARIIMHLVSPDSGEVFFDGKVVKGAEALRLFRRKVRMVFQDPFSALDPRFTIEAVLREALVLEQKMTCSEIKERMARCLGSVGLPGDILSRYPHEFSGGERQRICIARALMTGPSLLILDEAVSSLDVLVQQQVLKTIDELRQKTGLTLLVITHNLRVARSLCQKIAVMKEGRVIEYDGVKEVFDTPKDPYTRQLMKAAFDHTLAS